MFSKGYYMSFEHFSMDVDKKGDSILILATYYHLHMNTSSFYKHAGCFSTIWIIILAPFKLKQIKLFLDFFKQCSCDFYGDGKIVGESRRIPKEESYHKYSMLFIFM